MSFYFYIFFFFISSIKIYSLHIHKIIGNSLKAQKIIFHNNYWLEIEDCPLYEFEDYCSIYLTVYINEYYIDNELVV